MSSYIPRTTASRPAMTTTSSTSSANPDHPEHPEHSDHLDHPDHSYSPYSPEDSPEDLLEDDENASLRSQALNADGTPKRPMNAFMIFARRRRPQVSAANQMMRTGEISKILSKEWNTMPINAKQFYLDQAKKLKEHFNTKYPDYVYRRRPNNSRKKRRTDAAPYHTSLSPQDFPTDEYGSISPVDAPGPPYRLPYALDTAYYSSSRHYSDAAGPAALPSIFASEDDHFPHAHPGGPWHPGAFPAPSKLDYLPKLESPPFSKLGHGHGHHAHGHTIGGHGHGHGPYETLRLSARRGHLHPSPLHPISHGHGGHSSGGQHTRNWSDGTGSSVSPPSSAGSGGFPPGFGSSATNGGTGYGSVAAGHAGGAHSGSGLGGGLGSLTASFYPGTSPSTSTSSASSSGSGAGAYYSHARSEHYDSHSQSHHSPHLHGQPGSHTSTTRHSSYSQSSGPLGPTLALSPANVQQGSLWSGGADLRSSKGDI